METFTEPRDFIPNPRYAQERQDTLASLDLNSIDTPIREIVARFAALPYCFPLQSCFGHFVCLPGQDIKTLDPIPKNQAGPVRYRIAYVALCIENSRPGHNLFKSLAEIPLIDPATIQFGSPGWFWKRWVNSYALQVEPTFHMKKDEAIIEMTEALHIQKVRDLFFEEIRRLLSGGVGDDVH